VAFGRWHSLESSDAAKLEMPFFLRAVGPSLRCNAASICASLLYGRLRWRLFGGDLDPPRDRTWARVPTLGYCVSPVWRTRLLWANHDDPGSLLDATSSLPSPSSVRSAQHVHQNCLSYHRGPVQPTVFNPLCLFISPVRALTS
jgi:hypothetical protein